MATGTTNPVIETEEGAKAPSAPPLDPPATDGDKSDSGSGIGAKVKAFLDSKQGVIIMAIVTMIMAIVSIVGVNTAYNELNQSVNDLESVVDNWNSQPIVDMTSYNANSTNARCPTGFSELSGLRWPGANSLGCACPANAQSRFGEIMESSAGSCNSNQTSANCVTDSGVAPVSVPFAFDSIRLCIKRGGTPAADRKKDVKAGEACPSGTVRCGGSGSWDKNRVTCQPSQADCPILRMRYDAHTGASGPNVIALPDNMGLFLDKTLTTPVASNGVASEVGPAVNFDVAINGQQCFGDEEPETYTSRASPSFSTSGAYQVSRLPGVGSCSKKDDRFFPIARISERQLLTDAFDANTQCQGSNNNVPSNSITCGSNDGRCNAIINTPLCDKLKTFIPSTAAANQFTAVERPEIFWASSCELSRKDVIKNLNPIADARDKQNILRILNILFNVFSGFLIPILLVYNAVYGDVPCVPHEGQAEKNIINFVKVWASALSKLSKLIPLIIIQAQLNGIRSFLQEAQGLGCSDSTTSGSLDDVTATLDGAYSKNFITVATDSLGMLYSIYQIIRELTDGTPLIEK